MTNKESMIAAMEGVTIVVHVASPINRLEFKEYDDYIRPTMSAAEAIIEGAKKEGSKVNKIIITSSNLTVCGSIHKPQGSNYDESDHA